MLITVAEKRRSARGGRPLGYAAITLAFVALILFACRGPRGSDQFWYLGDTFTLMAGEPPLTNTIFPGPLLRDGVPVEEFYFIHHSLVPYMGLPFAKGLGAYRGWIAFNVVSALIAAVLIAVTLHRLAGPSVALIGYGVFLMLPLTIWQTGNMLQEAAFCLMTALLTVLYVFGERGLVYWIALFAVCSVAVLCHPLYLPLAGVLPLVFLWQKRRAWKVTHFAVAGFALGAVALVQAIKSRWFPVTFPHTLTSIIVGAIPDVGNMEWHFRTELSSVTMSLMISKVWEALKHQFAMSPSAVFFWPANVMLLGSLLLISRWKEDPRIARLGSATLVFIGLFVFLVSCHTNQFRSSLIIMPATLMSTAVFVHRALASGRRRHVAAGIVGAVLVVFATIDVSIARYLHREGQQAATAIADIRRQTQSLADDQRVVIEVQSSGEPLMLAYALRPRKCLVLMQGYLPPRTVQRLLAMFDPKIIFCRPESDLPQQAGATRLNASWPRPYDEFEAYEVRQAGTASR